LEAQRLRGIQAQQFLEYLKTEGKYFTMLFEELDGELNVAIGGLTPMDRDSFTVLQARRQSLYEPLRRIEVDIQIGQRAAEELSKATSISSGGIL